ncbi:MAG: hypothetical protein IE881_03210 [Epsilonproteobacteria bacterium]|nr:hypothetical protein [Campylobacterota bacterium]
MREEYNFTNSVSNPYLKNTKSKMDETEYLMSSLANAKRLLESIENIKRSKGLKMKLDDFENELLKSIENNEKIDDKMLGIPSSLANASLVISI